MQAGDWKEMFLATQENDLELVRYHLKTGVDPNFQHAEFMTTPLIESLQLQHYEIAKLLLEYGAIPVSKKFLVPILPFLWPKPPKTLN